MSLPSISKPYSGFTPYLIVNDGAAAISFYQAAFGAVEQVRLAEPNGKIAHAELKIGEAAFMLADEYPEMGYKSPSSLGGSPVSVLIYVENVDQVFAQALTAGAKEVMAPSDQFDGDRRGTLADPFGHVWLVATKIEDVPYSEMIARFQNMLRGQKP